MSFLLRNSAETAAFLLEEEVPYVDWIDCEVFAIKAGL